MMLLTQIRILSKKMFYSNVRDIFCLSGTSSSDDRLMFCKDPQPEQVLNGHCDCSEGSGVLPPDLVSFFHQCAKTARVVERMRLNCCMYYD